MVHRPAETICLPCQYLELVPKRIGYHASVGSFCLTFIIFKIGKISPPVYNAHHTETFRECICISCIMWRFCLLTYVEMCSIREIKILLKSSSTFCCSNATPAWIHHRPWSLGFSSGVIWKLYGSIIGSLCKMCQRSWLNARHDDARGSISKAPRFLKFWHYVAKCSLSRTIISTFIIFP